jgi:hypothetical protein
LVQTSMSQPLSGPELPPTKVLLLTFPSDMERARLSPATPSMVHYEVGGVYQ